MPDITNPQVVKLCNERLRHFADYEIGAYREAKTLLAYAAAGGVAKLVSAVPDDLVSDGSETDGRGRISGAAIIACLADAQAFVDGYEAAAAEKLLRWLNVSVNPR